MIHRTSYFKRNKKNWKHTLVNTNHLSGLYFPSFWLVLILTLFKYMYFIFYRTKTNLDFYHTYGKCYLLHIFIDFVIFFSLFTTGEWCHWDNRCLWKMCVGHYSVIQRHVSSTILTHQQCANSGWRHQRFLSIFPHTSLHPRTSRYCHI